MLTFLAVFFAAGFSIEANAQTVQQNSQQSSTSNAPRRRARPRADAAPAPTAPAVAVDPLVPAFPQDLQSSYTHFCSPSTNHSAFLPSTAEAPGCGMLTLLQMHNLGSQGHLEDANRALILVATSFGLTPPSSASVTAQSVLDAAQRLCSSSFGDSRPCPIQPDASLRSGDLNVEGIQQYVTQVIGLVTYRNSEAFRSFTTQVEDPRIETERAEAEFGSLITELSRPRELPATAGTDGLPTAAPEFTYELGEGYVAPSSGDVSR